jgi:regulator of RNase E activity RraB
MANNIHERLKELATQYGLPEDADRPMEFFFYAPNEDAVANLSISLHELGYKLYERSGNAVETASIAVIGHTPMMSTASKVLAEWYESMSELAENHDCIFDGYGTLITEPEDGWDWIN